MKLFRFSDHHTPRNILGNFIVESENIYYYFSSDERIEVRQSVKGFWLRGVGENDDVCFLRNKRDSVLYGWNIGEDKTEQLCVLPKGKEFYGAHAGFYIFQQTSSYSNRVYTIWNKTTDSYVDIATGRGGSLIFVDNDVICYRSRSENKVVSLNRAGDILWSLALTKETGAIYTWYARSRLIIPLKTNNSRQILIIDVFSGKEILKYDISDAYQYCKSDECCVYIKTSNHLIVYDDSKKSISFDESYNERIGDINVQKDKLYVILENPVQIQVYNKVTMALLIEKQLIDFHGHTGLIASSNSRHLLALYSDILEEKRGFTWICSFTDDEIFSDDWRLDFEPAYYDIEEKDDFSGGVSLNVTFSIDIDFDTLYRHVSTGLQTAAFRNGMHRFTEGKSVNKRFNGTVVANFEGHVFTQEQKKLIEDLCDRTTEYFGAGMNLLSGDGSKVCHVTSIIPAPHNL